MLATDVELVSLPNGLTCYFTSPTRTMGNEAPLLTVAGWGAGVGGRLRGRLLAVKVPVTVNDLLDGRVGLDIECLDRIYFNGYVPNYRCPEPSLSASVEIVDLVGLRLTSAP